MSTMISPLQLLDFSHLTPSHPSERFSSPTSEYEMTDEEDERSGHRPRMVASIGADGSMDDEEAHRMQGDVSHALRVSVGAHRAASIPAPAPLLSPSSAAAQPVTTAVKGEHSFTPLSWTAVSDGDDGEVSAVHCNAGQSIRFSRRGRNGSEPNASESLCFCPFDWQGERCEQRVLYQCPIRLVLPATSCNDIRSRPPSTSSASLSAQETPFSLSPSSSSTFFRYEPVLSGTPPPCLSVSNPTTLAFNFTCSFLSDRVVEGWGDPARYAAVLVNHTQQETVKPFNYSVLVPNPAGGPPLFAMSQRDPQIHLDLVVHNTAHPSQSLTVQRSLNPSHLYYAPGHAAETVQWSLDPASLAPNLKRGGRILLTLFFVALPGGLLEGPSLLPWRLYVEDGTFRLPAAASKALLTRFQLGVVIVAILLVLALLTYRWWQRRQTAKFQQLMAEQRGKQKSWFEQSE